MHHRVSLRAWTWAAAAGLLACGALAAGEPSVTFHHRRPQSGDEAVQEVQLKVSLSTSVVQGDQILESASQSLYRREQRHLELLEATAYPTRARVTFEKLEQQVARNGAPAASEPSPVVGRTYLVARQGDELLVTDAAGRTPPPAQLAIVQRSLAGFGKPNPLVEYFAGRTVQVGETLRLPGELAQQVFAAEGAVNEVSRFELRLMRVVTVDQAPCAEFETTLAAQSSLVGTLDLLIQGTMQIEVATCRVLSTELSGPIGLFGTQRTAGAVQAIKGQGTLEIAIRSQRPRTTPAATGPMVVRPTTLR
jgi:hypothetical protein